MHGSGFNNKTKCIFIINAISHLEKLAFSNEKHIIPINDAFRTTLDAIYPFAFNNVFKFEPRGTRWQVRFFIRVSYSSVMAVFYWSSVRGPGSLLGSLVEVSNPYRIVASLQIFGCIIPFGVDFRV
jgi:hypothetical protein